MTGWAVASILIGTGFILGNGRLARWLALDDETLMRYRARWPWARPARLAVLTRAWAVVIGLVFVAMGVGALV